jgi:hypothetical protein
MKHLHSPTPLMWFLASATREQLSCNTKYRTCRLRRIYFVYFYRRANRSWQYTNYRNSLEVTVVVCSVQYYGRGIALWWPQSVPQFRAKCPGVFCRVDRHYTQSRRVMCSITVKQMSVFPLNIASGATNPWWLTVWGWGGSLTCDSCCPPIRSGVLDTSPSFIVTMWIRGATGPVRWDFFWY